LISIETARSGHQILKKSGRLLASSYHPLKEAATWAEAVMAGLGSSENVIVLGVGCGYHVVELARRLPTGRVLAIESDAGLFEQAKTLCPELGNFVSTGAIAMAAKWTELPGSEEFRDFACGAFRIARHLPSCEIDKEFYDGAERLLQARDRLSLLLQLKMRPELLALIDPDAVAKIGDGPISIKTMKALFNGNGIASRERMIWRALEELVL
jgi:hypothetical protein